MSELFRRIPNASSREEQTVTNTPGSTHLIFVKVVIISVTSLALQSSGVGLAIEKMVREEIYHLISTKIWFFVDFTNIYRLIAKIPDIVRIGTQKTGCQ